MTANEVKQIDDRFIACLNNRDVDACADLVDENVVWKHTGNPEPYRGKDGVREIVGSWITAFPDFEAKVENRVVSEDCVAVEFTFKGTNRGPLRMNPKIPEIPATGKRVQSNGAYFLKLRNGNAIEITTYTNAVSTMTQLGLLPKIE